MMKIKKVATSEDLLKIYFFKLYAKKCWSLNFDEEVESLIRSKTFEQLSAEELFSYCLIHDRWNNHQIYTADTLMPDYLYFFGEDLAEYKNIESHPFLYTSINLINNTQIYEAKVHNYLSELYDTNGKSLNLIFSPNLYDNGFTNIFSVNENLICCNSWDDNNGNYSDLFSFNNNELSKISCIENKQEILSLINQFEIPDILSLASDNLKNDKEVVLASLSKYPYSIDYASEELKNNKEFISFSSIVLEKDNNQNYFDNDDLPF